MLDTGETETTVKISQPAPKKDWKRSICLGYALELWVKLLDAVCMFSFFGGGIVGMRLEVLSGDSRNVWNNFVRLLKVKDLSRKLFKTKHTFDHKPRFWGRVA